MSDFSDIPMFHYRTPSEVDRKQMEDILREIWRICAQERAELEPKADPPHMFGMFYTPDRLVLSQIEIYEDRGAFMKWVRQEVADSEPAPHLIALGINAYLREAESGRRIAEIFRLHCETIDGCAATLTSMVTRHANGPPSYSDPEFMALDANIPAAGAMTGFYLELAQRITNEAQVGVKH